MTSRRGVGMDRKPDKVGGRSQESSGDKPTRLFSTGCEFDLTVELSYFTVIGLKSQFGLLASHQPPGGTQIGDFFVSF